MRDCASSVSHNLEGLPSLPLDFPDTPDIMEESQVESTLIEKKLPSAKSSWPDDTADLFILLCSFLLSTVSLVFVTLVFHAQGITLIASTPFVFNTPIPVYHPIPFEELSILQRVISALSLTITTAVIMVAGRRYVLFKLTRGGLRSRRVAIYSNPSIGNLASYLVIHGAELPLLGLSAVWGLALVTGLTVNNSWEMGSTSVPSNFDVPFGPFDPATPGNSWIGPASEQLTFVMSSLCLEKAGTIGLINITSGSIATDQPMGIIYYPPLPYFTNNVGFSLTTTMNGFNISMEQLSSIPSTAQSPTCAPNIDGSELWYDGSDNQTLSIIVDNESGSVFRFNASAVLVGGTLSSSGNYTEFAPNGTSWPNVTPTGNQWAQDITSLICNTTTPGLAQCAHFSLLDFAYLLNLDTSNGDNFYPQWSTALNMALGAYTFAMYPALTNSVPGVATLYDAQFTLRSEIYILIANIIVSFIMLVIVVGLRLTGRLGADFINSTRLLLDPLKKPELFNASLATTVDVLADPEMRVERGNMFVLAARKSSVERRVRRRFAFLDGLVTRPRKWIELSAVRR